MRKFNAALCGFAALLSVSSLSFSQATDAGQESSASISRIAINVTPETTAVTSSESVQFTALVRNTPNVGVVWSASAGTISSTGLYRAPKVSSDTAVTVTATSRADHSKSYQASILVKAASPVRAAEPATASSASSTAAASTTIKQSFFGAGFNGGEKWPPTDGQKQVATLGSLRLWDDGVKWAQIETCIPLGTLQSGPPRSQRAARVAPRDPPVARLQPIWVPARLEPTSIFPTS
jgi:hypothetical protein